MDPAGPGATSVPLGIAAAAAKAQVTSPSAALPTMAPTLNSSALFHASKLMLRATSLEIDSQGEQSAIQDTCSEWIEWTDWGFLEYLVWISMSAMFAAVCAFLVKRYAPYAAGSGISEIKCVLSGFIIDGFLGFWTLVIKSIGLPLAIASGLSVGKEGPAVHVACCIGNVLSRTIYRTAPSQAKIRELLTASSAAGVAVAFGSPIGGVLFALEEMTSHFPASTMWRTFLCALASTAALSFMNPFRTGKLVMFQVEYNRDWHYFELAFYILIGIMGGLYGEYVVRYNLQVQRFRRKRLAYRGIQEAVFLAAITAAIAYFNRFLRLDMTESLEVLFRQCEGARDSDVLCQSRSQWSIALSLLIATGVRFMLVILSYGCKVPAGIFIPSMAVGATFGRMVGIFVKALQTAHPDWRLFSSCPAGEPCVTPGTYAVMGAAGALAGVTRITVAVVVIMFELTGALTYILPIMLVVGISKLVADLHGKGGVSDRLIKFNGYPYLEQEDHGCGSNVGALLTQKPSVLYADGLSVRDVEKLLARGAYKGFPVVQNAENVTLLGYAALDDLRTALRHAKSSGNLTRETICTFHPSSSEVFALTTTQMPSATAALPNSGTTPNYDMWGSLPWFRASPSLYDEQVSFAEDVEVQEDAWGAQGAGVIDLGAWVDPTPLTVSPNLDLDVVAEMFRKLGPRVILVVDRGLLVGIVTIKDMLKHVATKERQELSSAGMMLPESMEESNNEEFKIGMGKLEAKLDAAYLRLATFAQQLLHKTPWAGQHFSVDQIPLAPIFEQED
ncbi:glycerol ethanol, ferric requiring protein [Malassezia psittaci]|uniref:Chloride channel protein n=1 Tax=Malassezia psittaci TaxID=1821823 RepID=A0AAF0JCP6_9BASI|nr:glycerol ethanol, ferric requiring protein [Malassezia psittaci]